MKGVDKNVFHAFICHWRYRDTPGYLRRVSLRQYGWHQNIIEYAKECARGICQLCGEPAPFKDKNGSPYLETHHIIWLAAGGADSVDNTIALCPNCHRKMHVINDPMDVKVLLEKAKKNL